MATRKPLRVRATLRLRVTLHGLPPAPPALRAVAWALLTLALLRLDPALLDALVRVLDNPSPA